MFLVKLNRPEYSYDVHSLIKAFYPEETVKVITPENNDSHKKELAGPVRMELLFDADGCVTLQYYEAVLEENERIYTWNPASEGRQDFSVVEGVREEEGKMSRSAYKNSMKRFLYETLKDITGKELPWGNLTGIRPTKIVMGMLEEGKAEEEIRTFMREKHLVSKEKTELGIEIAKRERKLLSKLHVKEGYSLYIGIPFCPTTCLYCSFTSYPICAYKDQTDAYIDCLIREMELTAKLQKGKILDTVYIGGGTPTTLEPDQLLRIITSLKEIFDFSAVQEFTVEAGRADSITREKLEVLYQSGVTRISVNPQTMKEETLQFIGRRATAAQTVEAYHLAREVGFDNINMDMILGLPGEDEKDVAETIEKIVKLDPDSLTVHSLAVKRASKLRQFIEENGIEMLHNTEETMAIATEGAKRMNMHPYYLYRQKNMTGNLENVGFAREGKYGIYNILIMEEVQTIIACGAGTVTKRVYGDGRIERCDNVKDVNLYISKIEEMIDRKRQLFAD